MISYCWEGADRSYDIVSHSRAAYWRRLFQIWKFIVFAYSQYGFNLFARWHLLLWLKRWAVWGWGRKL